MPASPPSPRHLRGAQDVVVGQDDAIREISVARREASRRPAGAEHPADRQLGLGQDDAHARGRAVPGVAPELGEFANVVRINANVLAEEHAGLRQGGPRAAVRERAEDPRRGRATRDELLRSRRARHRLHRRSRQDPRERRRRAERARHRGAGSAADADGERERRVRSRRRDARRQLLAASSSSPAARSRSCTTACCAAPRSARTSRR